MKNILSYFTIFFTKVKVEISNFRTGYLFLFSSFSILIYILLFDNLINYPHQEVYELFTPVSFQGKPYFNKDSLLTFFNPGLEGGTARIRFLNWIFWVFDSIFRYQVFKIIPFHPSISLAWLFSLTLLPYFLFKYLHDLTNDKTLSLQCVGVFLFTQGYLSLQTLHFHSAKPMSILGIIASMYFTQKIKLATSEQDKKNFFKKLIVTVSLSLFWDEFYYIYFIIAPFIYPDMLKRKKVFIKFFLLYFFALNLFFTLSTIIYPYLSKKYFGFDFNFWSYSFSSNKGLLTLKLSDFIYNLKSMLSVHIYPFKPFVDYYWRVPSSYNDYILLLFTLITIIPFIQRKEGSKKLFFSILYLLFFWIFQSLIVSRRDGYLQFGSYYWGSPFSLFFVISVSCFWVNYRSKFAQYFRIIIFLGFCLIGYRHTEAAAYGYLNVFKLGQSFKVAKLPMKNEVRPITREEILFVWRNSSDMNKVREAMKDYPVNAYWLYFEALLRNLNGNVTRCWDWYNYDKLKKEGIFN